MLKRTVADDAPLSFRGPAKVVHSRDEGVAAAKAGGSSPGDVVVLTGLGLRGSPGMGLTSALMFAIDGAGLSTSVAVITDGQMSGLVNGGLVVAEVSPEGAAGGPLGLVRDGDMISIDVNARAIELEVGPAELDAAAPRCRRWPRRPAAAGCRSTRGRVAPLGCGATLGAVDRRTTKRARWESERAVRTNDLESIKRRGSHARRSVYGSRNRDRGRRCP